jgi:HK97 gp10 family phage protein
MQGEAALRARFEAIPRKIRDELAREMEAQAAKVVADMKRLVPVDTGALRDSIGWTWGNAPAGSVSIGTVKGRQFGKIAITIFAGTRDKSLGERDAFYAHFVEFGAVKRPAQPFFFPAWRANKTRVNAALKRAVNRAVKRA